MSTEMNRNGRNRDRATKHSPAAVSAALMVFLASGASAFEPTKHTKPTAPPAPAAATPVAGEAPAVAAPKAIPSAISNAFGRNRGGSATTPSATNAPAASNPSGAAAAETSSEPKSDSVVRVNDSLVVDLHVNDEDLTNVLQMLSIQSQRNIVASNNVSAKVKADLYGVTFYEALDAILHVNGYGYIDKGNFIYVYTLEELQQIEKASRVRVSKVVHLNFLNAIDAAEFVKPLLSEGGQIKTNGKTEDFAAANLPVGKDNFAHDATLVVYDYQEHVEEIEKLVKELDTRPAQVLVEATILQTQLNETNAFGVDFSLIADLNFSDFSGSGGPLKSVDNLITGQGKSAAGSNGTIPTETDGKTPQARAIQSTPGNTSGPGTLKLGLVANDVAAFVRMLDEVTDTTILSNPKVMALNRQPARVLVGRKVGYLNTTSTDTTSTQSVQFLDTGTQLNFRPFVSNDGLIRLELKPQVSEAVVRDTRDATGAAVTIPDEITNELVTNVMVRDGQTVVLGGLFRESTQATRRQVPFLGDVPFLGAAFRGHEDETQRQEIIFLITPSIVNDQILTANGKDAVDYVDRARAGAREGILPWSRDKLTSMKLVEAEKLAAEGKTEKALWKIDQSLSMNPVQPDAIAMRERLTNERTVSPSRSMLQHILHKESRSSTRAGIDGADFQPLTNGRKITATASVEDASDVSTSVNADAATVEETMPATSDIHNEIDTEDSSIGSTTTSEGSAGLDTLQNDGGGSVIPEATPAIPEVSPVNVPETTPVAAPETLPANPEVAPATNPDAVNPEVIPATSPDSGTGVPSTQPEVQPGTTPSTEPKTDGKPVTRANIKTLPAQMNSNAIFVMSGGVFSDAANVADASNILWGKATTVAAGRANSETLQSQAAMRFWFRHGGWKTIESTSVSYTGLVHGLAKM